MKKCIKPQLFNLENFDKIPEYQKMQKECNARRIGILIDLSQSTNEIKHFFTEDEEPQPEYINFDSDEAEIIENRLQFLPYYTNTDESAWIVDEEAGWIYESSLGDLTRIPYNEKLVSLLWTFDDLCQQYESAKGN